MKHTPMEQFWCEVLNTHDWLVIAMGKTKGKAGTISVCLKCGTVCSKIGRNIRLYRIGRIENATMASGYE